MESSSQKCSIWLLELNQLLLPGSCTVFLSLRTLGQRAFVGLWGAEECRQKPQGEKDEASIPGGDYHKGWTHMSLRSEVRGMRTGWKLDKYSEFSCFQFYFSVVEPSCKQKLNTEKHDAVKEIVPLPEGPYQTQPSPRQKLQMLDSFPPPNQ